MEWLLVVAAAVHLIVAPYTKVEESFNIQACHDILYHGLNLDKYDHLEFPGVVPRTFLGPIGVSAVAFPIVFLFQLIGISKFYSQYVVRAVLGLFVILALKKYREQLRVNFGNSMTTWFVLITASQFHFMYYLSRPLPNTFALIVAILVYAYWLEQKHKHMVFFSGVAVLIFRSELCLLLGPILLADLVSQRIDTIKFLRYGIPSGFLCLAATIGIDSCLWKKLLWAEGDVFWFNTYQNQSHNWGIYPFLWYWYSALPRALAFSLLMVPVGIFVDRRVRVMMAPALLYVTLYSFLPHKELRFIIYVIPILNMAAARACHFFWENRYKSTFRQFLGAGAVLHLLGNCCFTLLLLTISSNNYPGGIALHTLHKVVPKEASVHVHIDNFAAQTGVSRFAQVNENWRYNKTEGLRAGSQELRSFTHLLVEAKSKYSYNLKHYTTSHQILASIDAFSHLNFNYQHIPPLKVRSKPSIFILKNLVEEDIDFSFLQEAKEDIVELDSEELVSSEGEGSEKVTDGQEGETSESDKEELASPEEAHGVDAEGDPLMRLEEEEEPEAEPVMEDVVGSTAKVKEPIEAQEEEAEDGQQEEEPIGPVLPEVGCFAPEGVGVSEKFEEKCSIAEPSEARIREDLLVLEERVTPSASMYMEAEQPRTSDIDKDERSVDTEEEEASSKEDENIAPEVVEESKTSEVVEEESRAAEVEEETQVPREMKDEMDVPIVYHEDEVSQEEEDMGQQMDRSNNTSELGNIIASVLDTIKAVCWKAVILYLFWKIGLSLFGS
ncbi:alg12 alpha-1,6-mannosyltransferase isoform X2 [Oratosquilla oratoria]